MPAPMFSGDLAEQHRAELSRRATIRQAAARVARDCGGFFSCRWQDLRADVQRMQLGGSPPPCPC
jgi:hypothetical protein